MTYHFIDETISRLEQFKINYLIVGSCALILHGEKKHTNDLDIFVPKFNNNSSAVKKLLCSYNPTLQDVKVDFQNIIRINTFPFSIDLLPRLDGIESEAAFQNSLLINWKNRDYPVIAYSDLLKNINSSYRQDKI